MGILKVARMGHPVLRRAAEPVSVEALQAEETQSFIQDMVQTMDEYEGVGLAAPQVHVSKRIVVIGATDGEEDEEPVPLVLVNPEIRPLSQVMETGWEGCLSIPDIRGQVPRFVDIEVTALLRDGKDVRFEAKGYAARVIQHEVDHLEGILYLDRMQDFQSLSFLSEYRRYSASED